MPISDMKFKGKEIKQTGTDKNRQELLHHKEIHIPDRKSRSKEQTEIDRSRFTDVGLL